MASEGTKAPQPSLPVNKLRADQPAARATSATSSLVPLIPLTAAELAAGQSIVDAMPPLRGADSPTPTNSPLILVSDGWNARNAVDRFSPLLDPAPAYAQTPESKPATSPYPRATAPAGKVPVNNSPTQNAPQASAPARDWTTEPRSTLKFITPRAYGLVPTTEDGASSGTNEPVAPQGAGDTQHVNDDDDAMAMAEAIDEPVVDPEQNEPTPLTPPRTGADDEDLNSEDAALEPGAAALEPFDDSMNDAMSEVEGMEELPAESLPLDSESEGDDEEGLEVRPLLLGVDGSLAGEEQSPTRAKESAKPATTKRSEPLNADSISVRSEAKQSVGDEPTPRSETVSRKMINVDHIGPAGDLILAIGMGPEKTPITAATARLRVPIERTLNYYWSKPENADERTHWGMFHVAMVYDKDTPIIARKTRYNAVAWMAGNNACRSQLLFEEDERGINVKSGIGLQGHQAQLLAVFGLIDVPAAYPIYVGRKKYSVNDVIKREMADCKSGNELTFTLIGLSHYIDTDSRWTAHDGQDWDFERLIEEELAQPIVGAACGGTHRLMGFAHALRRRRAEGKPITGQWERADLYVKDFINYTWQLQNRDGSMSTAWFEKAEDNGKVDRKIQTTGHMVEFLLSAVPDDQLQSPQMLRSISFLANTLNEDRNHDWQVGPKGHALRALAMYYRRTFGRPDPWRPVSVARHGNSRSR